MSSSTNISFLCGFFCNLLETELNSMGPNTANDVLKTLLSMLFLFPGDGK